MTLSKASRLIEAVLFRSAKPIEEADLQGFVPEGVSLQTILQQLQDDYATGGVHLVQRGTAWCFITAPDLADDLVLERQIVKPLSRAAMETLAIIAYYQPITRLEIEDIRGVGLARTTLDHLLEAGWVVPVGHRPVPGRPTIWGTTNEFLQHFNLSSLHDLPLREELIETGMVEGGIQGELFSYSSDQPSETEANQEDKN